MFLRSKGFPSPIGFAAVAHFQPCSGNVGLSLGHPLVNTSLSGQFTTFSKVVLCLMMIRGRHRMLPYALDRAVMLPSESQLTEGVGVPSESHDEATAPTEPASCSPQGGTANPHVSNN